MEPEFLILSRNCWSNVDTHEISSDRQEYWKVQLPYFRKHNIKKEDCTSKSDYWLYNIANMDTMEELAFKEKTSLASPLTKSQKFNTNNFAVSKTLAKFTA